MKLWDYQFYVNLKYTNQKSPVEFYFHFHLRLIYLSESTYFTINI